jgi:UDP-N-acetylglucosamine 2-epimerase (non-hydrolysing)
VVTLHRPANVDSKESLAKTLDVLEAIGARIPAVFPVHPRTTARARELGLSERMGSIPGLILSPPVGYNDFVALMAGARFIATDSGGIQEETTALGIPCLTLRENTERPITVTLGTNTVVGLDIPRIVREVDAILAGRGKKGSIPEGWDGRTGERIADAIEHLLAGSPPPRTAARG